MNARPLFVVGSGLLLVALAPNGCAVRTAHHGDDAVYPLVGGHEGLSCESCHGDFRPGKPEPQSHSCIACHSGDVPAADHFPSRECSGCHTVNSWAEGVYTAPEPPDTSVPDPQTADTGVETGWVHNEVMFHQLCWDCHGSVLQDPTRPTELRPPNHWTRRSSGTPTTAGPATASKRGSRRSPTRSASRTGPPRRASRPRPRR